MLKLTALTALFVSICLSMSCATGNTPAIMVPPSNSASYFAHQADGATGVIIFVHGVFGGADGTWRNDYTRAYWPEMVAKDVDFISNDVYVVSYLTPFIRHASNIEEISQRLLQQLDDRGLLNYKRIYFITHSMGGLIVKRILNILDRPSRTTELRRVRAVLLISTPSQGAPTAALGAWLSMNPQLRDMAPADFNTFLQGLENDWLTMLRERDRAHENYPQVFCAYETQRTGRFRIATRVYDATRCDNTPYPMDYNHIEIVKPRDIHSDPYPWAKARIREADNLIIAVSNTWMVTHHKDSP